MSSTVNFFKRLVVIARVLAGLTFDDLSQLAASFKKENVVSRRGCRDGLVFLTLLFLLAIALILLLIIGLHYANNLDELTLALIERQKQPLFIILTIVHGFGTIALTLGAAYSAFGVFSGHTSGSKWLYTTLGALALQECALFVRLAMGLDRSRISQHLKFYSVHLRFHFVVSLLVIGMLLYLFKKASKLLYGFSEIVIAIATQLALINGINLTNLSESTLSSTQIIGIGGLTYVLARGVTNVVEGFSELRRFRPVPTETLAQIVEQGIEPHSSGSSSSTTDSV